MKTGEERKAPQPGGAGVRFFMRQPGSWGHFEPSRPAGEMNFQRLRNQSMARRKVPQATHMERTPGLAHRGPSRGRRVASRPLRTPPLLAHRHRTDGATPKTAGDYPASGLEQEGNSPLRGAFHADHFRKASPSSSESCGVGSVPLRCRLGIDHHHRRWAAQKIKLTRYPVGALLDRSAADDP